MRRIPLLVAAAAAAALLAPAAAAGAEPPATSTPVMMQAWAYAETAAVVRSAPDDSAMAISRLRFTSELGNAEVYEISARIAGPDGRPWLRIDVLGRPNGRFGWVRETSLGVRHAVTQLLVISRSKLRATLLRNGRRVWSAPVGVGKPGTPTPAGTFYVREAISIGSAGGAYGPFAFGTSAYSPGLTDWPGGGVIGIHGTDEPGLLPGRVSHGCIRLRNADILRLRSLLRVGARLEIR